MGHISTTIALPVPTPNESPASSEGFYLLSEMVPVPSEKRGDKRRPVQGLPFQGSPSSAPRFPNP